MASLKLTGLQIQAFRKALIAAYPYQRLKEMLAIRLEKQLQAISLGPDLNAIAFDLIETSRQEGWTKDLIRASLEANPDSPELIEFVASIGFDPLASLRAANLEKVVTPRSPFQDVEPFLAAITRKTACVCRIDTPDDGGTGFLISADLVMTNRHVIASIVGDATKAGKSECVFDYKKLANGLVINPGRSVPFDTDWLVHSRSHDASDETGVDIAPAAQNLDYAIVRLAEPVGDEPIGANAQADPSAHPRGWFSLRSNAAELSPADPLLLLQHPLLDGKAAPEPMQVSLGSVLESPFPSLRLRHNARTLGGSSGSPCLDASLEVVALHHAGDPARDQRKPKWNQAIPVRRIVEDAKTQHQMPVFWDL